MAATGLFRTVTAETDLGTQEWSSLNFRVVGQFESPVVGAAAANAIKPRATRAPTAPMRSSAVCVVSDSSISRACSGPRSVPSLPFAPARHGNHTGDVECHRHDRDDEESPRRKHRN